MGHPAKDQRIMLLRALLGTTLLLSVGAEGAAFAAHPGSGGSSRATERSTPVAHWDTHVVEPGSEVRGLNETARESIERWRTFAEKRGYRIDLDPSQRILVLSDEERFEKFSGSMAIIERVLDETEAITGPRKAPAVILRASGSKDKETARTAADALGFGGQVFTLVEKGTLRERRAVDARLAEAVVRAELSLHLPFLSEWMADGIASTLAEECTGRAIIDGHALTLHAAQSKVSRAAKKAGRHSVNLLAISGTQESHDGGPMEAEAMAVMAYLRRYQGQAFNRAISELGSSAPIGQTAKYKDEERAIRRHSGIDGLNEIERALQKGRSYRPK